MEARPGLAVGVVDGNDQFGGGVGACPDPQFGIVTGRGGVEVRVGGQLRYGQFGVLDRFGGEAEFAHRRGQERARSRGAGRVFGELEGAGSADPDVGRFAGQHVPLLFGVAAIV